MRKQNTYTVMWFHLDHRQERKPRYHWRLVAVATSENPNGPFHLHHAFHPSGLPSLDVSLFQVPANDNVGNKVGACGCVWVGACLRDKRSRRDWLTDCCLDLNGRLKTNVLAK